MRKGFIVVVLAIVFATVGFASRNTSAGQSVADRFEKFAKDKAKEKGRELSDREKQAKEKLKDVASEAVGKLIDRYIPGGDNKPAKTVADSVIHKEPWYKAFLNVFFTPSETGESNFTDPQQTVKSKPVVPAGPFDGTPTTYVKSQPVVPAKPSNENASSPKAAQHESGTQTGRESDGSQRDVSTAKSDSAPSSSEGSNNNSVSASNGPSNQGNAGTGTPQAMPQAPMEKIGEGRFAVVDANKQNAPSAQQSAPAPAAAPSPAPQAAPAPAAAPSPAPQAAPAPVQQYRDPSSKPGGGGGEGGHMGRWTGADHPSHVARDTA